MKKRDYVGIFLIVALGVVGDSAPIWWLPILLVLVIGLYLACRAYCDAFIGHLPHY